MDSIYLDNNASTPMLPAVVDAMRPFFVERAGNPASSHHAGREARRALEDAREKIASLLHAHPDEVIFTSGATEANNLAIFGLAGSPPGNILLSQIEHPCVLEPVAHLAKSGFEQCFSPVGRDGIVDLDALAGMCRADTRLICLQLANHETGAVQPVAELAERVAQSTHIHCDAAAAVGKIPVSFRERNVSTLTISAHKFHGPKGIAALLVRRNTKLQSHMFGGHQQRALRPGTEPVFLVVGFATALELAVRELNERRQTVTKLRETFLQILQENAAPVVVNGPKTNGVPHTLNVSFPGCKADLLLMRFDLAGIACSTGSACSSGSLLPSPVLRAMRVPDDVLQSAMRFSFSHLLSETEVREAANRIATIVKQLRRAAPSS